jgi:hypothetical protein
MTGNREAHELLQIEEADAWFEYADSTKGQHGSRYAGDPRPPGAPGPVRRGGIAPLLTCR